MGAVLVRDRSILATGYNGSPSGQPHCDEVGCLIYHSTDPDGAEEENCFRTIHAEINAIAQAASNGTAIRGADIYITHSPCYHCGKVLIAHEDSRTGGIGESLAAVIQEEAFEDLDAPVRVVGALDTPVPYAPSLEDEFLPGPERIERAARLLAAY